MVSSMKYYKFLTLPCIIALPLKIGFLALLGVRCCGSALILQSIRSCAIAFQEYFSNGAKWCYTEDVYEEIMHEHLRC